jgi:hypothetical protein
VKNAMLIICFAFTANLLADGKMGNSTKESNAVVKTPCNHQIHRHCLRKLVKEKRGKKCPCCRADLAVFCKSRKLERCNLLFVPIFLREGNCPICLDGL